MTYIQGATPITNTDQAIDSRDVIARIEYLANDDDLTPEESEELDALREFQADAEGYVADWQWGETLIHEDYFVDYVKELLADVGTIPADFPEWIAIDWEETANNVKVDYTELTFDGVTYYAR